MIPEHLFILPYGLFCFSFSPVPSPLSSLDVLFHDVVMKEKEGKYPLRNTAFQNEGFGIFLALSIVNLFYL